MPTKVVLKRKKRRAYYLKDRDRNSKLVVQNEKTPVDNFCLIPKSEPEPVSSDMDAKSDGDKQQDKRNNKEVPLEVMIVRDEECLPEKLVIKGFEKEDEECSVMTIQEIQDYILKKVENSVTDPNVNPVLTLRDRIESLRDEMKTKIEELIKLNKLFNSLYENHVKFLQRVEAMSKLETKTVSVGVDLPWLPETLSACFQNESKQKTDGEMETDDEVTITAVKTKKDSGPVEFIDLTDDVDALDPPKSMPADITDVKNIIIHNKCTPSSTA